MRTHHTTGFSDRVNSQVDREWQQAGDMQARVITQHATHGDTLCALALDIFFSTYGSEAGAVALKYLCFGGLYVAGGIAPKNIDGMTSTRKINGIDVGFMPAFHDKGRVSKVLKQIPLYIVKAEDIGQRGAQLLAYRALSRRWAQCT